MANTVTLAPGPIGGGTLNAALSETLWLGGKRFFMVYGQTAPNYLVAVTIDLANDPYSATNSQTTNAAFAFSASVPSDRPMLLRLDCNRVLMIYSASTTTDAHYNDQTLAFDAVVFEIATDGSVTVAATLPACAPSAFLNYTAGSLGATIQPTFSRAPAKSFDTGALAFIVSPSFSAPLTVSADGASVNRVLICTRNNVDGAPYYKNISLWDIQYTVATKTLAVVCRFTGANQGWGQTHNAGVNHCYDGFNDFPYIYMLPGATKVLIGWVNHDPANGGNYGGAINDTYINTVVSPNDFYVGNQAYVFDYTQAGTTWSASNTISCRRGSVLCPLDSDKMIEFCNQITTSANGYVGNYVRVYSIVNNQFSGNIKVDGTTAKSNQNASAAIGAVSQMTPLGNGHLLIATTPRDLIPSAAYFGIYSYAAGYPSTLTVTPFGLPSLLPITFQRGLDALILRGVNDPANASAYDFFGRTNPVTYVFVRYTNPH